MEPALALSKADYSAVDDELRATDSLLRGGYPGDAGSRQPIHTVYVPADQYHSSLPARWGEDALQTAGRHGGIAGLCSMLEIDGELVEPLAAKVIAKLETQPIEDLRIDFEDGYGDRGDEAEDSDARAAARHVAEAVACGDAPPFIGIRFKSLEERTRARGLRTVDLFLSALLDHGELPSGLAFTLPKVSTVSQVLAMVRICERLETAHALEAGRLRFEVQVETPQLILGCDGVVPVAQLIHQAGGRVSALHYGTYDYSASVGISAEYQSMEHSAADYAKSVMQVAVAGTGVRLSDGSTNVIPVGDHAQMIAAWKLHARLVQRSLERGYYQGWDLHPAHIPTRFIANYRFYLAGFAQAASRLRDYLHRTGSGFLDEPATARALAGFIHRGVLCGAIDEHELAAAASITVPELAALAHPPLAAETSFGAVTTRPQP